MKRVFRGSSPVAVGMSRGKKSDILVELTRAERRMKRKRKIGMWN